MFDYRGDSDIETSGETLNSSMTSMSSSRRSSFDATIDPPKTPIKPHRASDSVAHEALLGASYALPRKTAGCLSFRDFRLVRMIGGGDIGKVYLCQRRRTGGEGAGDEEVYAMKVVDKEAVALKKKSERAEMEKKILKMVDHPFLPSLVALFEDSHFSCVVMDFCPGGDLHILRHKQPHKRFSLSSARYLSSKSYLYLSLVFFYPSSILMHIHTI